MEFVLIYLVLVLLFSICFFFGYSLAMAVWRMIAKARRIWRMAAPVCVPGPRVEDQTDCPEEIVTGLTVGLLNRNEEESTDQYSVTSNQ